MSSKPPSHILYLIGVIVVASLVLPLFLGGGNSLNIGVDGLDVSDAAFKFVFNNTAGVNPDANVTADDAADSIYFVGDDSIQITTDFDTDTVIWNFTGAIGGGEDNLGANVGGATGEIFRDKTGVTLNFKTVSSAGDGIVITNNADTVGLSLNNIPKSEIALAGTWIKADLPSDTVYRNGCNNGEILEYQTSNSTWICATDDSGGVSDGDKTDITVTSSGTVWNIDTGVVGDNELASGLDASQFGDGSVSTTEFQYINSLSSNAQTQIDNKLSDITSEASTDLTDTANIAYLNTANVYVDGNLQTFQDDNFRITDTANDNYYTFSTGELSANRVVSLPILSSNDVFVFQTASQTLTNKNIDADNNSISNIDDNEISALAAINANKIADGSVSSTEFQHINSLTSNAQTQLNNKLENINSENLGDLANVVDACADGEMIEYQSSNSTWICVAMSASENTSASNIGTGFGVFSTEVGDDLRFDSLIGGDAITITDTTDDLTFSVTGNSIGDAHLGTGIDTTQFADGSVTSTEFQYINSLGSNAQTQLDNKYSSTNRQTNIVNSEIDASANIDKSKINTSGTWLTSELPASTVYNTQNVGVLADVVNGCANGEILEYQTSNSTWICATDDGGVPDGDKTDITVSSGGTVWTIDSGVIGDSELGTGIDTTQLADGSVTSTEFQYINSVTSDVQTQINNRLTDITGENIETLANVTPTGCADQQILKYQTSNSTWICDNDAGAGGGITSLNSDSNASQTLLGTSNEIVVTDTGVGQLTWSLGTNINATNIADGSVTSSEFQFINTLSSNAQTQLDNKLEDITGESIHALANVTNLACSTNEILKANSSGFFACAADNTGGVQDIIQEGDSNVEVIDGGTGQVDIDIDAINQISITSTQVDFTDNQLINVNSTTFNVDDTLSPSYTEGLSFYDSGNGALVIYNDEAEVTQQLGQEGYIKVKNESGSTITNGQVVYISGADSVEFRPLIGLARSDAQNTSEVIGVATHDIENNTFGYITSWGVVNDVDTSSFVVGDVLYLDETTAGTLRNSTPPEGNYQVQIGYVVRSDVSVGKIVVSLNPELGLPSGAAIEIISDVQKGSVGTINAGEVVYITGYDSGADVAEVELADASTSATMPAIGIALDSITQTVTGSIVVSGEIINVNTGSFTAGEELWVSETTGAFTNVKPVGSALIQKIGIVTKSHVSQGVIEVIGAGRSNDIPNIATHEFNMGGFNFTMGTGNILGSMGCSDGQILEYNSSTDAWTCGTDDTGGGSNALLDGSVHTDTVAQTVSRGSLIYGNASPAWDELVVGGANTMLISDGTDPSWGTGSLGSHVTGATTDLTDTANVAYLNTANEFIENNVQTFHDDDIELRNPANTFDYILSTGAIVADRTISLPILGANDVFVFQSATQTLSGKSIDADTNTITNIENADIKAGAAIAWTKISKTGAIVGDMGDVVNGCADTNVLKWQQSNTTWICATDITGGAGDTITEGDSNVEVIDLGTGQVDIDIDGTQEFVFTTNNLSGINSDTTSITNIKIGHDDFTNHIHADVVHVQVRNESGGALARGDAVYVSGYSIGSDLPLVSLADSSSSATMPAFGIVSDTSIANNANGAVYISGKLEAMDTSAFTAGNVLYISNVGTSGNTLTATQPTGTDLIEQVGEVLRDHASLGVIEVELTGVEGLPNIATHALNMGGFAITNVDISSEPSTELSDTANIAYLNTANTFADTNMQTFQDDDFRIADTTGTEHYVFSVGDIAADRTVTIPVLAGNDVFVMQSASQTLSGKSIDADTNTITNIENADIKAAAAIAWSKITPGASTTLTDTADIAYLNTDNTYAATTQTFTPDATNAGINVGSFAGEPTGANGELVYDSTANQMKGFVNGAWVNLGQSGGGSNALLDGSAHTDTVAQAPTRGSIIYADATPNWNELVVGGANQVLQTDGTDAAWATLTKSHQVSTTVYTDQANTYTTGTQDFGSLTIQGFDLDADGTGNSVTNVDTPDFIGVAENKREVFTCGQGQSQVVNTPNKRTVDAAFDYVVCDFDTTTAETIIWSTVMPDNMDSTGTIDVTVNTVTADNTASSCWDISFLGLADGDVVASSFSAVTGACTGVMVVGDLEEATMTGIVSGTHTLNAGEVVYIKLDRDVAADSNTGDVGVISIEVGWN